MSVLARIEPRLKFPPATDEPEDRATADVADRAIEVIQAEVGIRALRQYLATWVGLTGGAWIETGMDNDPRHGMMTIEGPPDPMTGQPTPQRVPRGKMYIDVASKFEMFFDPAVTDWRKQRKYGRRKSVSEDEAKARWPHLADRIKPDAMSSDQDMYAEALPGLGPNIEETRTQRGMSGMSSPLANTRVTETWYYALPDDTYPEGLLTVLVGREEVAFAGPLPYKRRQADGSFQPMLNHVFFPMKLVPGSAWPKTVADDLALKQTQRNRWEALCELIGMRTANPVWLMPNGSNIVNMTGEPGQTIGYNALGPSPAKPERIPGQNIPATVIRMLEMFDRDFEDLASTYEVLKGNRPPGVSAGIALEVLRERAMSKFAPMFILWEDAWAEWAGQALEIFRQFATEERLLQIKGKDGRWQVQKFVGADLTGSVNVIAEAGSSLPRSTMTERADTERLISLGVLNVQDPETRYKILQESGKLEFIPEMAADTKNAMIENEAFDALAQDPTFASMDQQEMQSLMLMLQENPAEVVNRLAAFGLKVPRVRPAVDDHAIHSREHGKDLKSEHSMALPIAVQLLKEAHKAEHDRLLAVQMQAIQGLAPGKAGGGQPVPGADERQNPLTSGSSPQRMAGDAQEMSRDAAAGSRA